MSKINVKLVFVFLLLGIFASSCISKKKHLEALQTLRTTNERVATEWQNKVLEKRSELRTANNEIEDLKLQLAERKGENNILVQLRDELQNQIAVLESQMNNQGSQAKTAQQSCPRRPSSLIKKNDERCCIPNSILW